MNMNPKRRKLSNVSLGTLSATNQIVEDIYESGVLKLLAPLVGRIFWLGGGVAFGLGGKLFDERGRLHVLKHLANHRPFY